MDLLLDVNVVVDICAKREPFFELADLAVSKCHLEGGRLWLYTGSVQTLEYVTRSALKFANEQAGRKLSARQLQWQTRQLVADFSKLAHWLSALPDEGEVFASADPEDEQLLRAMERFPSGEIKLLTRDARMLDEHPDKVISPRAFLGQSQGNKKVDFIDLKAQQDAIRPQLERNIHRVLHHGRYIMGPEIQELEQCLADYVGVEHCITCSSGTDSLLIAMMALGIGPGDEVITTPFTFIATGEMIALLGARPVFVDIDPRTYNIDPIKIEAAISPRTRAIMPVSLYGQPADLDAINAIAEKHGLPVIEDGAQSFGATYKGRKSCGLSTIGSTSFFPSKPLGGYGDGGALFTDDAALATAMREIRIHGQDRRYHHPRIGINGRMDTLQAAIVLAKLDRFGDEIAARQQVAARYNERFAPDVREPSPMTNEENTPAHPGRILATPYTAPERTHVYAQYTIDTDDREALQAKLKEQGIPAAVHYPVGLHRQPAFRQTGYGAGDFPNAEAAAARVMSLPMHPRLTLDDQVKIVQAIRHSQ